MCGICGVYNRQSGQPVSQQLIEEMTSHISHRGPDDRGVYLDNNLGFGFARLSIIDPSGSRQPMSNEAGDVWIVCNGEIWNYEELRADLLEKDHQFRSRGDTETIVHAYEEYGVDCIARLHGMFGLAIWDSSKKRLLLARDRAGKKPLYYTQVGGDLLFASEIKALLFDPRVQRQVDMQALADYLSVRYVPGPATLFANIYKVQPGHWILFEKNRPCCSYTSLSRSATLPCEETNGNEASASTFSQQGRKVVLEEKQFREECYWDFKFGESQRLTFEEYIWGIRQHIHRAVEERMIADVPVGALLSGGVDSSIITGIMSQLTSQPIKTFSVGFDVAQYSELPYARLVAKRFSTEHHELTVKCSDLSQYWPLLTWHRDEPVSEPSDLAVYLVSKLAREHVKVVLSGEGSDELFAGYPKYVVDWLARYYHLLPAGLRNQVITPLLDQLPYGMRKLKTAARTLSEPAPQRWLSWFGIFNGQLKDALLSAKTKADINNDSSRIFRHWLEEHPQRDDLSSMLYLDTKIWLPDNLLMKSDKMTMAASLEARLPLLDHKLIEYAASIPSEYKVKPFAAKYLLKQAYAGFLPETILNRKKMGFNVPTGTWFREGQRQLITRLLLSERARSRGFFNEAFVARMLREHLEGKTNFQAQLFTLASLELWFRIFIDNTHLECPQGSVEELLQEKSLQLTYM